MTQNKFWPDIQKDLVKVVLGLIAASLFALLLTVSSNIFKASQKAYELECITKTETQTEFGSVEVKCPPDFFLTGGGIKNNIRNFKPESVFEESFPNENTWECDMGLGSGSYTCYARCCKLK